MGQKKLNSMALYTGQLKYDNMSALYTSIPSSIQENKLLSIS